MTKKAKSARERKKTWWSPKKHKSLETAIILSTIRTSQVWFCIPNTTDPPSSQASSPWSEVMISKKKPCIKSYLLGNHPVFWKSRAIFLLGGFPPSKNTWCSLPAKALLIWFSLSLTSLASAFKFALTDRTSCFPAPPPRNFGRVQKWSVKHASGNSNQKLPSWMTLLNHHLERKKCRKLPTVFCTILQWTYAWIACWFSNLV